MKILAVRVASQIQREAASWTRRWEWGGGNCCSWDLVWGARSRCAPPSTFLPPPRTIRGLKTHNDLPRKPQTNAYSERSNPCPLVGRTLFDKRKKYTCRACFDPQYSSRITFLHQAQKFAPCNQTGPSAFKVPWALNLRSRTLQHAPNVILWSTVQKVSTCRGLKMNVQIIAQLERKHKREVRAGTLFENGDCGEFCFICFTSNFPFEAPIGSW